MGRKDTLATVLHVSPPRPVGIGRNGSGGFRPSSAKTPGGLVSLPLFLTDSDRA
jgi:hypothetical protein